MKDSSDKEVDDGLKDEGLSPIDHSQITTLVNGQELSLDQMQDYKDGNLDNSSESGNTTRSKHPGEQQSAKI